MITLKRAAVMGVAAAMAFAGCTSSDTTTEVSSETPPATVITTSASPSPSEVVATTAQYASIVAEDAPGLRETFGEVEACTLVDSSEPLCSAKVFTLGLQADTLRLGLTGAQKKGVPAYIGLPPAEIKALVDDTIKAATDLVAKAEALDDCESDCFTEEIELRLAGSRLVSKLDAWAPYGVR